MREKLAEILTAAVEFAAVVQKAVRAKEKSKVILVLFLRMPVRLSVKTCSVEMMAVAGFAVTAVRLLLA